VGHPFPDMSSIFTVIEPSPLANRQVTK
jgi:hypothetical protein